MAKRAKGPTFIQRSRAMSSEEKAMYHNVAGAGKSRVTRVFFELDDADIDAIVDQVDRWVTSAVSKAS